VRVQLVYLINVKQCQAATTVRPSWDKDLDHDSIRSKLLTTAISATYYYDYSDWKMIQQIAKGWVDLGHCSGLIFTKASTITHLLIMFGSRCWIYKHWLFLDHVIPWQIWMKLSFTHNFYASWAFLATLLHEVM